MDCFEWKLTLEPRRKDGEQWTNDELVEEVAMSEAVVGSVVGAVVGSVVGSVAGAVAGSVAEVKWMGKEQPLKDQGSRSIVYKYYCPFR